MAKPAQAQISFLWGHPAGVRTFPERNSGSGSGEQGEKPAWTRSPTTAPFQPQFPGQQLEVMTGLLGLETVVCSDAKGSMAG